MISFFWQLSYLCVCAQSHLTLCNPVDLNPPGSSLHEILQARILERVAISYSRGTSPPRIKPMSPASPALAGRFFITEPPGRPPHLIWYQRIWHGFFLPSWHIASTWLPKHSIFSCSSFQDLGHFHLLISQGWFALRNQSLSLFSALPNYISRLFYML